jgi:hypothetical protein
MVFDVVPVEDTYRGMDRSLTTDHLYTKKTRKIFKELLEKYFKFIDMYYTQDERNGSSIFEEMLIYCRELCAYGISCEMIVYDSIPIADAFGHSIELLGIDIVCDMCESFLVSNRNTAIQTHLNDNGLCKTEEDAEITASLLDCHTEKWMKCYVYKVHK